MKAEYDFSEGKRGNYQTLINDALCEYIQQQRELLEEI